MEEKNRFIPGQLWKEEFRFLKVRVKGKEPTSDMKGWQNKNFKFNDTELLNHLKKGGNYGIIGGYGNLILVDADSKEINELCKQLPTTFTIKSGSVEEYKHHYYFIADEPMKAIRLSKEHVGDLGDIRSVGQYVVAPTSIHPSGNEYKVIKDVGIANISEKFIRSVFKEYIDPNESTEKKEYESNITLRNSRFIKYCNVPDYCSKNKLKGETSKNWKLFPYIVDILFNRQCSREVYERVLNKQEHKAGAIGGWIGLAKKGELAKCSCKKMQEYLKRFHKEKIEEICGKCPLYKKIKQLKEIKENKDYSELQREALTHLALKERDEATELIVQEIKKNNFIYTTRDDIKSEMWIYKEGVYVPQGKSFVKEFCRKILDKAYTTQLFNNVVSKIEADTFIEHDSFFSQNHIHEIPILNGVLNVKTRELSEHTPKKIFFNKLPINYDPSAECEKIIEHFKTILKNQEDIKVMFEIFGFLLLKEYKIEKAFMFVGDGRNGKSKTIELMKRFLGSENCSSLSLKSLHEESFSLSELFGKMANLSADLSKTDLKETGMIKSLIGRDIIQAKRKFLRDINFVNYAKMIFGANELPKIYDTTDGFWTKWIIIEFPYKFIPEKLYNDLDKEEIIKYRILDPDIISLLTKEEELSGLLNMALDGLDRLLKNKDFSYSKGTKEVKDVWIRKSDSFMAFCYDNLVEDINSKISKKILRRLYHEYKKTHKVPGVSEKAMKITLENLYGVYETRDWGNDRERFWEGINLKNNIRPGNP